jgi:hypothetical protein
MNAGYPIIAAKSSGEAEQSVGVETQREQGDYRKLLISKIVITATLKKQNSDAT